MPYQTRIILFHIVEQYNAMRLYTESTKKSIGRLVYDARLMNFTVLFAKLDESSFPQCA